MPDEIDEELEKRVKDAKSGKRHMFALIQKGTGGTILVDKKITDTDISEAKKAAGGGSVYKGKCVGEKGILYFETTGDVPGTLANAAKRAIKDATGLTIDCLFRQRADADTPEPDGKKPIELPRETGQPAVDQNKPPEQVELEKRLAGMTRQFTVELTGTSEKAVKAQKVVADTKALIAAKNYPEGHRRLDALEAFLKRAPAQAEYEALLHANRAKIDAAIAARGGPQIKIYFDQATAAAGEQKWPAALKSLNDAIRLVGVAEARNPYLAELDRAKDTVERLLAVKAKPEAENAEQINLTRAKLKGLWDAQDANAKVPDYGAAIVNIRAALRVATEELEPLFTEQAKAAKETLAASESAVLSAAADFAALTPEQRTAKLAQVRGVVTKLFQNTDAAKETGVTDSGFKPNTGVEDRRINCEQMYKQTDWFDLKRRLNLPEKPGVLPANRENITPGEMKQLWDWRSAEVNKLIDSLRAKYPTLIAKACGSNDLESDIDITFATPGDDHFGDDIKAAKEFNERVIARFGKPAGRTFDVNIYCRDYRAIKESRNQKFNAEPIADKDVDQANAPAEGGMDFRSASAEDQDVAALMKQRRFMSAKQWQTHRDGILADIAAGIQAKNRNADPSKDKNYQQVAKQLDEAEDVFLLSLRKMLVGIQKTVTSRHPEMANDPKLKELEKLLRDPNAADIETKLQQLHKELTSGDYAAVAMEATDDMYLDQMAEVRANQKKLKSMPEGPEKESLKIQIKKDIFTNIFFANEAYTSEGAISHVVAGSQAGLTTEQLAEKLKPTETVQSANEQLADLLKDMEHYEDEEHEARAQGKDPAAVAGQAFVHASKYLERLLDATAILAAQFAPKKQGDPAAPELKWFAENVKDADVTGKPTLKEKSEALQQRVKGLLLNLRKSSKVPSDLKKPIAVDEVQQLFGVSTIEAFTAVMMKLGRELNSVVRQREQFQSAVEVAGNVATERVKNADVGERERAMNAVRKMTSDPKTLPPVQGVTMAFVKLGVVTGPAAAKMASELCNTWKTALDFLEQKQSDKLPRAVALLGTRVQAIGDVEVSNEFQRVVHWLGQAAEMLAMTSGPQSTPKAQQIVARINQGEILSGRAYELIFSPRWEQAKKDRGAEVISKLVTDMTRMQSQIKPVLDQLTVDIIEDVPQAAKDRIQDVMADLNNRNNDLTRRLAELEKLAVPTAS